jgi:hypothetical protein
MPIADRHVRAISIRSAWLGSIHVVAHGSTDSSSRDTCAFPKRFGKCFRHTPKPSQRLSVAQQVQDTRVFLHGRGNGHEELSAGSEDGHTHLDATASRGPHLRRHSYRCWSAG